MTSALRLLVHRAPEPFSCFLIPVNEFPIQRELRERVFQFVEPFVAAVHKAETLQPEVFLQFTQIHHENGPVTLSKHGSEWLPQLGLGVWPDREPPKMWTMEEFQNLAPGEMIRPLMHQVFRITTDSEARFRARDAFFGTGAGLQMSMRKGDEGLLKRATEYLLPRMTEPSFQAFEYYVPLLDGRSVEASSADDLETWLCGAQLYLRESVEDGCVLIVSRVPLENVLGAMGAVVSRDRMQWELPLTNAHRL